MQPLTQAIPGALAALLRTGPMSPAKLTFAWQVAVGTALARVTAVHLEGKVLLVDAQTAMWSREVKRSTALILGRLEHLLGPNVISEIHVRA